MGQWFGIFQSRTGLGLSAISFLGEHEQVNERLWTSASTPHSENNQVFPLVLLEELKGHDAWEGHDNFS